MKNLFAFFVLALVVVYSQTAAAYTGMTADELRAEIARLNKVADTIRTQLSLLGDSAIGVNPVVTTPTVPTNPTVAVPTAPTYTAPQGSVAAQGCLQATIQMSPGAQGANVQRLQEFLTQEGVYSSGATGYYGPATQAGVQLWQARHGIVSAGTPSTTGYGRVGPGTLSAMRGACGGAGTSVTQAKPEVEKYSLSLNTTGGKAPLTVTASIVINGSTCTSYSLDWGDTTTPVAYNSVKNTACTSVPISLQPKHTYTEKGSYTVRIRTVKGPLNLAEEVGQIVIDVH